MSDFYNPFLDDEDDLNQDYNPGLSDDTDRDYTDTWEDPEEQFFSSDFDMNDGNLSAGDSFFTDPETGFTYDRKSVTGLKNKRDEDYRDSISDNNTLVNDLDDDEDLLDRVFEESVARTSRPSGSPGMTKSTSSRTVSHKEKNIPVKKDDSPVKKDDSPAKKDDNAVGERAKIKSTTEKKNTTRNESTVINERAVKNESTVKVFEQQRKSQGFRVSLPPGKDVRSDEDSPVTNSFTDSFADEEDSAYAERFYDDSVFDSEDSKDSVFAGFDDSGKIMSQKISKTSKTHMSGGRGRPRKNTNNTDDTHKEAQGSHVEAGYSSSGVDNEGFGGGAKNSDKEVDIFGNIYSRDGDSDINVDGSAVDSSTEEDFYNPMLDDPDEILHEIREDFSQRSRITSDEAARLERLRENDERLRQDYVDDMMSDREEFEREAVQARRERQERLKEASRKGSRVKTKDSPNVVHPDDRYDVSGVQLGVFDGDLSPATSNFVRKNVREVVLKDGMTKGSGSIDEAAQGQHTHGIAPKMNYDGFSKNKGTYYRYNRGTSGKINEAELQFFKNLSISRSSLSSGYDEEKLLRLRGRRDKSKETPSERKARKILEDQAVLGPLAFKRGGLRRITDKDRQVLQFLALFRYANDRHLARMWGCRPVTMYNRLIKLRDIGLVVNRSIYGTRPIWFLTEAGMIVSGLDVRRVTDARMSFSMFPHQFAVNHVAANLWGANINVLNLEDYPAKNRVDEKGVEVFGEQLVSELEIQSSLSGVRGGDKAELFVPEIKNRIDRDFRDWERAGGTSFGDSPEFQYGNEFMWALYPPYNLRKAYHVPDLVVKRPRNPDGTPESIAVEVEISNKKAESYQKTLLTYKSDRRFFKKVVWVCKNIGPARKLEQIAKDIGLWQAGRIDIVPILTEDGVFKDRDLWLI